MRDYETRRRSSFGGLYDSSGYSRSNSSRSSYSENKRSTGPSFAQIFQAVRAENEAKERARQWLEAINSEPAAPSFVSGIEVKTPDGYTSIETIQVGDMVISRNPTTRVDSKNKVSEVHTDSTSEIFEIHYSDGTRIEAAGDQRFFTGSGREVEAEDLQGGDLSLTEDSSLSIVKVEKKTLDQPVSVYRLEVENDHTYFVTRKDVWVHN